MQHCFAVWAAEATCMSAHALPCMPTSALMVMHAQPAHPWPCMPPLAHAWPCMHTPAQAWPCMPTPPIHGCTCSLCMPNHAWPREWFHPCLTADFRPSLPCLTASLPAPTLEPIAVCRVPHQVLRRTMQGTACMFYFKEPCILPPFRDLALAW